MISVICVWNNEKQFHDILVHSLNNQNCEYELISIDNRINAFSSCAIALNWVADHFSGGNVDLNYMKKFKQLISLYKHKGYI